MVILIFMPTQHPISEQMKNYQRKAHFLVRAGDEFIILEHFDKPAFIYLKYYIFKQVFIYVHMYYASTSQKHKKSYNEMSEKIQFHIKSS